jgi:hypothetical protein
MATKKEEQEEQEFFAARLREGNKPMATKKEESSPAPIPSTARPATFIHDPSTDDPTRMKQVGPQKVDMTGFDDGSFRKKGETKKDEPYQLMIVEDDPMGHTHHLKNQDHFWSGTEEQFKAQFDRE